MVSIFAGDLVKSGGVEFHIKHSEDGRIQYWAADTGRTSNETFDEFIERCRQRGNIIIEPDEGKFESDHKNYGRERVVVTAE